jgi:hypothetical protein
MNELPSVSRPVMHEDDPLVGPLLAVPPAHLPNAFLVGAMKSGSSWLAKQLERHPSVFVPGVKEPNLLVSPGGRGFDLRGPRPPEELFRRMHRFSAGTVADYEGMYAEGEGTAVRVDASIRYLVSGLAADRIARLCEATGIPPRILVILRDPVERTWSHWQMHRAMGIEPLGFSAALAAEEARMADGWSDDWAYKGYSRYDRHLPRYLDRFGRENVHVEIQEEAVADPAAAMARVFAFLGLDPALAAKGDPAKAVRVKKRTGSSEIEQVAQYWRPGWRRALPRPLRQAVWRFLEAVNARSGERQMPKEVRAALADEFRPVVSGTEDLLGRPLPWTGGRQA